MQAEISIIKNNRIKNEKLRFRRIFFFFTEDFTRAKISIIKNNRIENEKLRFRHIYFFFLRELKFP